MSLFWEKGQDRIRTEYGLLQAAVREAEVDVRVAMKQLKRSGRSHSFTEPAALAGKSLESALMGMSATHGRRGSDHRGFYVEVTP